MSLTDILYVALIIVVVIIIITVIYKYFFTDSHSSESFTPYKINNGDSYIDTIKNYINRWKRRINNVNTSTSNSTSKEQFTTLRSKYCNKYCKNTQEGYHTNRLMRNYNELLSDS